MRITDTDKKVMNYLKQSGKVTANPSWIGYVLYPEPMGVKKRRSAQGLALAGMKAMRNAERKGLVLIWPANLGYSFCLSDHGRKIMRELEEKKS